MEATVSKQTRPRDEERPLRPSVATLIKLAKVVAATARHEHNEAYAAVMDETVAAWLSAMRREGLA
jgi:hypothetical protein